MAVLLGLMLLSAGTLLFEINLTRLFSVAQFYHFAFMIVSLALLGFGASGTALALWPQIGRRRPARALTWLALGFAITSVAAYLLTNLIPFDSFGLTVDRSQLAILAGHYLVLAAPFFCSGAAVGLLLASHPARAAQLYFVNLLGSSAGCLLAIITPGIVGGEGVTLLSASLGAAAALLFIQPVLSGREPGGRRPALFLGGLSAFILVSCLVCLVWQPAVLAVRLSPYKDLSYALNVPGARTVSSRWNAFSRVDLVASPAIRSMPGLSYRYVGSLPQQNGLTVDGGDLSGVAVDPTESDFAAYLPGALAYRLSQSTHAIVLEPRGGLDVLTAHAMSADHITAVEPNALVVAAAGPVYQLPDVQIVIESGRSFARGSGAKADVVTISLNAPYRPVQSGAYSLGEDYRYTVDAFEDYLALLAPGGILQATRWLQTPPSEETRLFLLAVAALENRGGQPTEQILFFRGYNTATILVKPDGFTSSELELAAQWLADRSFDLIYAPGVEMDQVNRYNVLPEPIYYRAASAALDPVGRPGWLAAYPFDLRPPTDDHPFFNHFFRWSQAAQVWLEAQHTWQPFGGAGYFVVLALLLLATAAAAILILLPLVARKSDLAKRSPAGSRGAVMLVYFGLIGLGFLLVEIPLFQQFILFLGQPVYGLAAVLFALLLFSSLGSRVSGRLAHRPCLAALVIVLLSCPYLLPRLFSAFLGSALEYRIAVALSALAPLGFLLGVPFPSGIRRLGEIAAPLIPWAWGINGALSVVASVGAALLALSGGFSQVLLLGAICYLAALVLLLLPVDPPTAIPHRASTHD